MSFLKRIEIDLRRVASLYEALTLREFLSVIISHFIKRKFDPGSRDIQRLFLFLIASSDKKMSVKKYSSNLLLVSWEENGRQLKMLVRKYSRDLAVFTEFFLEEGYLSYIKQIEGKENIHTIIDAGANIGCATIYLTTYFPNAKIVSVEPEPTNYSLFIKNIGINGIASRVDCLNKAIWNTSTHLNLMQRDWSSDGYHVMKKNISDEIISTTETTTITEIIQDYNIDTLDFLKIDIEGAEKALFEDEEQLKEYLPKVSHIALEVHEEFVTSDYVSIVLKKHSFVCKVIPQGEYAFVIANKRI